MNSLALYGLKQGVIFHIFASKLWDYETEW